MSINDGENAADKAAKHATEMILKTLTPESTPDQQWKVTMYDDGGELVLSLNVVAKRQHRTMH